MKKLVYGLILLSLDIYAQELVVIDLDRDSLNDKVYLDEQQGHIVCELSTQGYKKIESSFIDDMDFADMKYITITKSGFELHLNWMRAGSSYQFAYDKSARKIRWIGYKRYNFGNAVHEGSGEETLNLITNRYHAQWHTFNHAREKLIALKPIKIKTHFSKIYLEEFGDSILSSVEKSLPGPNNHSENVDTQTTQHNENKTLLEHEKQLRTLFKDEQYAQMAAIVKATKIQDLNITRRNVDQYINIATLLANAGVTHAAVEISWQIIKKFPYASQAYKALGDAYKICGEQKSMYVAYGIYIKEMKANNLSKQISPTLLLDYQRETLDMEEHQKGLSSSQYTAQFRLVDEDSDEILAFYPYRLSASSGEILEGYSTEDGFTQTIFTTGEADVSVELRDK